MLDETGFESDPNGDTRTTLADYDAEDECRRHAQIASA